ncbi:hypothetical protein QA600_19945 [Natronococcus sp. A-GB1]|uniref:hypothetical protein n=1 Tax=Natronococcus sp. A-GB1 TaxID=3037648 RepID=UPI00241DE56F|nr:hypothetical protein [Natronococcus sp. A-GB1]MDG5761604.1 hypothetical protein [Natronococcus sp. A-GB1]
MVDESNRPSERAPQERGQMVVLGAIALAVVVFGIVATTGALEAGSTTETSADAGEQAVVEAELERGVGCLLENASERAEAEEEGLESAVDDDLEGFADRYGDARAHSSATVVDVKLEGVGLDRADDTDELENATVRVTADSADHRTERTSTIEAGCPGDEP